MLLEWIFWAFLRLSLVHISGNERDKLATTSRRYQPVIRETAAGEGVTLKSLPFFFLHSPSLSHSEYSLRETTRMEWTSASVKRVSVPGEATQSHPKAKFKVSEEKGSGQRAQNLSCPPKPLQSPGRSKFLPWNVGGVTLPCASSLGPENPWGAWWTGVKGEWVCAGQVWVSRTCNGAGVGGGARQYPLRYYLKDSQPLP